MLLRHLDSPNCRGVHQTGATSVTLRAPQVPLENETNAIEIYELAGGSTDLLADITKIALEGGDRVKLAARARQHTPPTAFPLDVDKLERWFARSHHVLTSEDIATAVRELFGVEPAELAQGSSFRATAAAVADELLATSLSGTGDAARTQRLVLIARLLGLLSRHAVRAVDRREAMRRLVQVPSAPFKSWPAMQPNTAAYQERSDEVRAAKKRTRDAVTTIAALTNTTNELATLARAGIAGKSVPKFVGFTATIAAAVARSAAAGSAVKIEEVIAPVASQAALPSLSNQARAVLHARNIDIEHVGTVATLERLEHECTALAHATFGGDRGAHAIPIGTGTIVVAPPSRVDGSGGPMVPGACPPDPPGTPTRGTPTVPAGVGAVNAMGIADLMVMRQRLVRYEAGEISHIENVLGFERRERVHRLSLLREEEVVAETERTEETTRDLSTNERFELQREVEQVTSTQTQFEMSASASGSFGPFSGEASVRFARNTSREESSRIATGFAREVSNRSITRIQQRVLERRSVRTVTEQEETNSHTFDNRTSTPVVGVYRWVDAVYEARVVNYGRRLMLEAIVPEPAAFWHHARQVTPLEGVGLPKPTPPGFCALDVDEMIPLTPGLVTQGNYLYFVGRYGARDVSPPPPRFRIVATTIQLEYTEQATTAHAKSSDVLTVPEGYLARHAWVAGNAALFQEEGRQLHIYIGRHHAAGSTPLDGETANVPISMIGLHVAAYAYNIEVLAERSPELFAKWQHDVYASIMTAYEQRQADYERELAQLRAQSEDRSSNLSSEANRMIIERELRRGAINVISGQQFEAFDAMRSDVAPHGYPEIDLVEAKAEAKFISFFEEASTGGT